MLTNNRTYNFSAGPATLPEPVLHTLRDSILNIKDSGIGILEHSHRGAVFSAIYEQTVALCREIAHIPDNYRVLFLQGGASSQFFMIPMNLLKGGTADYVNTGAWSKKAIAEAKRFGTVNEAASSADNNFSYIPKQFNWSANPTYVHITSNNTIFGTQFEQTPEIPQGSFLVCDASSDIFCRPIDIKKYGIVYAGAQKNLGPSGVTLVIIREDLIADTDVPTMLSYKTHADKNSMFNTPPTFAIYVVNEVLQWIKDCGGLTQMQDRNQHKAALLYDFLDNSDTFEVTTQKGSRSLMNVCFRGQSPEQEKQFIAAAAQAGLVNLKGHRSVGGMRASIYNAMPLDGVEKLIDFMKSFSRKV